MTNISLNATSIAGLIVVVLWVSGIVSVTGFWWTAMAIIPPYGVSFGIVFFLEFFRVL